MKNSIQNYLIRFSGLAFLFREIIQRKKVTILFIHNWDLKTAELSFKYLSEHYNLISLNDLIEFYYNKKTQNLPPKSLIITIDDGYEGNYHLLPLIKKYNIPVTIFLTAGLVNTKRQFWFDFPQSKFSKKYLKSISNKKRLELLKEIGFEQDKDFGSQVCLTKTQIYDMKEYVDFQSHTIFHPILPNCENDEAEKEIFESKRILEKDFDLNINSFAFPNGSFSERDIEIVKKAGYKCSLTTEPGFNDKTTNIYRLKRISLCYENLSKNDLAIITTGIRIYAFNFKALFKKKKKQFKK